MRVCISVYHPSYSYKVQENHLHFWAYISYMHSLCTRVCIVSPSAASYPCPSMPQRCKLSSWTLESVESSWRSWSWFAWPGWIGWISEVTCRKNQENGWKWEHCQKNDPGILDLIEFIFCHFASNDSSCGVEKVSQTQISLDHTGCLSCPPLSMNHTCCWSDFKVRLSLQGAQHGLLVCLLKTHEQTKDCSDFSSTGVHPDW